MKKYLLIMICVGLLFITTACEDEDSGSSSSSKRKVDRETSIKCADAICPNGCNDDGTCDCYYIDNNGDQQPVKCKISSND